MSESRLFLKLITSRVRNWLNVVVNRHQVYSAGHYTVNHFKAKPKLYSSVQVAVGTFSSRSFVYVLKEKRKAPLIEVLCLS